MVVDPAIWRRERERTDNGAWLPTASTERKMHDVGFRQALRVETIDKEWGCHTSHSQHGDTVQKQTSAPGDNHNHPATRAFCCTHNRGCRWQETACAELHPRSNSFSHPIKPLPSACAGSTLLTQRRVGQQLQHVRALPLPSPRAPVMQSRDLRSLFLGASRVIPTKDQIRDAQCGLAAILIETPPLFSHLRNPLN